MADTQSIHKEMLDIMSGLSSMSNRMDTLISWYRQGYRSTHVDTGLPVGGDRTNVIDIRDWKERHT
jgi:hypothetical protein